MLLWLSRWRAFQLSLLRSNRSSHVHRLCEVAVNEQQMTIDQSIGRASVSIARHLGIPSVLRAASFVVRGLAERFCLEGSMPFVVKGTRHAPGRR